MNKLIVTLTLCSILVSTQAATPPPSDLKAIKQVVTNFVAHVDARQSDQAAVLLHQDFRVVANQLMGSTEVSLLNKATYLELLEAGKIGGDQRRVTFRAVDISGNNAQVKATLKGQKLQFDTYFTLVKDATGQWLLVQDLPTVTTL